MRRRIFTTVAAAAMTTALLPATAAKAAVHGSSASTATAWSQPAVRLTVETSSMGDEAESTRAWVLRDGAVKLAAAGVNVSEDAAGLEVRVSVRPKELGYVVAVEIWEDGAEAPVMTRGPSECETCTRTEVVKVIEGELAWAGGWLANQPLAETAGEASAEEPDAEETAVEPASPAPDGLGRRRTLHALGWAGVGVATVGLGTLVGGLVVALRPYEARGEPGDYQVPKLEHPQHLGWALFGVGAAATIGGVVMLALDLEKNRARKIAAGPWLGRQTAGLWVRRSF